MTPPPDDAPPGDAPLPAASAELLPAVYEDLRRLARRRMAREGGGHTLQATALVHEAYLRLTRGGGGEGEGDGGGRWNSRGHFFAAAAESMRRILIEAARRKGRLRHGGGRRRVPLTGDRLTVEPGSSHVRDPAALAAALGRLGELRPRAAAVVRLRSLEGRTVEETAAALGVSRATAVRDWTYGRAWLFRELEGDSRKIVAGPGNP